MHGSMMNVRTQWRKLNEPIKICNFPSSINIGFFLLPYQWCMNVNREENTFHFSQKHSVWADARMHILTYPISISPFHRKKLLHIYIYVSHSNISPTIHNFCKELKIRMTGLICESEQLNKMSKIFSAGILWWDSSNGGDGYDIKPLIRWIICVAPQSEAV